LIAKESYISLVFHKRDKDQFLVFNISSNSLISLDNSDFKKFYEIKFMHIDKEEIYLNEQNISSFDKFPELKEQIEQIKKKPFYMVNTAFDNNFQKYVLNYLKIKTSEHQHFFKEIVKIVNEDKNHVKDPVRSGTVTNKDG